MPEAPRGTVTFLFSDIEHSTRLLQQLGERYAEVLAAYRRLLREALQAWDGYEIDTAGDGFFAAFQRATHAVAAAVAAQRAFAVYDWPESMPVRVRLGLHTGEPTLTTGGFIGLDVHRAARICAAGHGGQTLLSQTTHALVGMPLKRDSRWSIAYSEELISSTISATLQSTDRHHGIVGQERCHFQRDS